MNWNLDWNFKRIINDARKNPDIDVSVFVKMLSIQTKPDCIGDIFRTEVFAKAVEEEYLTPYDGIGYLLDAEGNDVERVKFDVKCLNSVKDKYPYVRWCNK